MRQEVRGRIANLGQDSRRVSDKAICRGLSSLAGEQPFVFVLGYLALPDEVRVDDFLSEMATAGKRIVVPRVHAGRLRFAEWHPDVVLSRDEKGVLAPAGEVNTEMPGGSGLMLVPGRAFDCEGRRLGRGGGYYDALLASLPGTIVHAGISYACQIFEAVPQEDHDRSVEIVVTEAGVIRAPKVRR
ncbi:MAG TPA: 5-formyltetrahydrofolate cyclo-ligase [Candidatus Limnocylindrales bacterium]|nr:5-formyltetrahydrofolate cyclo-ligase [Candidatus Limnocylindrales bacterium]